jgi:hypothetical protein
MTVLRYKSAKYSVERPLHIGAALAGATPEQLEELTAFGLPLGEAFQLRDDLLGVFGDPQVTGKPAGDDLVEGKRTVLVALGARPRAQPTLIVPRNRSRSVVGAQTRRQDVPAGQADGAVLNRHATVVDCARTLPFDEALAVADSALRRPEVDRGLLLEMAAALPRGRERVERVVRHADGLAANPFESVARAIALDVPGLLVVAQGWVGGNDHSDLVDHRLGIAVECESWLWHGNEDAWRKDVARFTRIALEGWIIVRLLWHDVMYRPDTVRAQLEAAVALGRARRDTFPYAARAGRQAERR